MKPIESFLIAVISVAMALLVIKTFQSQSPKQKTIVLPGNRFDHGGDITIRYWLNGKIIGEVHGLEKAILRHYEADSIIIEQKRR